MSYIDIEAIKNSYRPYDKLEAFAFGMALYELNIHSHNLTGVNAQAADRGLECASRIARAKLWIDENVGAN